MQVKSHADTKRHYAAHLISTLSSRPQISSIAATNSSRFSCHWFHRGIMSDPASCRQPLHSQASVTDYHIPSVGRRSEKRKYSLDGSEEHHARWILCKGVAPTQVLGVFHAYIEYHLLVLHLNNGLHTIIYTSHVSCIVTILWPTYRYVQIITLYILQNLTS